MFHLATFIIYTEYHLFASPPTGVRQLLETSTSGEKCLSQEVLHQVN